LRQVLSFGFYTLQAERVPRSAIRREHPGALVTPAGTQPSRLALLLAGCRTPFISTTEPIMIEHFEFSAAELFSIKPAHAVPGNPAWANLRFCLTLRDKAALAGLAFTRRSSMIS
jgi:hypothetical protein